MEKAVFRSGKIRLSILLLLIGVLYLAFSPAGLPDFGPYERIYDDAALGGGQENLFVFAAFLFRVLGFDYYGFRRILLVFGTISLVAVVRSALGLGNTGARQAVTVTTFVFWTFVLTVFFLEYFVVRIRAGLAIAVFSFAFCLLISPAPLRIAAGLLLVLASTFIHTPTAFVLILMAILPLGWSHLPRALAKSRAVFYLVCSLATYVLLDAMLGNIEERGEQLFSPLNTIRFVAIAIIPIVLLVMNPSEVKLIKNKPTASSVQLFPTYFVRTYLVMAWALVIIHLLGLDAQSGEALVRVYTLASIPAFYSLVIQGSVRSAPFSSYLLVCNSLFFVATVFFPGGV